MWFNGSDKYLSTYLGKEENKFIQKTRNVNVEGAHKHKSKTKEKNQKSNFSIQTKLYS